MKKEKGNVIYTEDEFNAISKMGLVVIFLTLIIIFGIGFILGAYLF